MPYTNEEVRDALKKSIKKWEMVAAFEKRELGFSDCALCDLFNFSYDCEGCPVMVVVGMGSCLKTPYTDWVKQFPCGAPRIATTPKQKAAAKEELKFLRSLDKRFFQP